MSIQETQARVEQVTPLTDTILHLILVPDDYIEYNAGQYAQFIIKDKAIFYSIANAPLGSKKYEFHIRHHPNNPSDQSLLEEIQRQGKIKLRIPFGKCDLKHLHSEKPILFIAAGTGYAPVNAMIEALLASGSKRAFELIWGARTQSDLYLDEKVKNWQNHVHQFQYISLLLQRNKKTLASTVLKRYAHNLNQWQMMLSGPFDLVYQTRDQLVAHGVCRKNLYSDAFEFEEML